MTARLKLPAYGKALINERRQGRHPAVVHVVFAEAFGSGEWCEHCPRTGEAAKERGLHPRLHVLPEEFAPFTLDWTLVTGCMVVVFDGREWLGDKHARAFYELVGEIGRFAGPVQVYRMEPDRPVTTPHTTPLQPVAQEVWAWRWAFWWDAASLAASTFKESGRWPFYWPAETEALNEPRRCRWWEHYGASREPAAAA